MDHLYDQLFAGTGQPALLSHLIPYGIIIINYLLFALLRSLINKLLAKYLSGSQRQSTGNSKRASSGECKQLVIRNKRIGKLVKLFADELISTCELCADCAELNVVYERHGSLAYGAALFLLTYLWIDAFGEAHTTPGYLVEDYFLVGGNEVLKTGDTYARFMGQSLAMPLAWRLASFYWQYKLLSEHKQMLDVRDCKSALNTSTLNGFIIELVCCLICRLIELLGRRLLERRLLGQRLVSLVSSFICTTLVVLTLQLSGGYFNPMLASSLEYGCQGIQVHQHAAVFWLGPLLGHVMARALFKRLADGKGGLLFAAKGAPTRGSSSGTEQAAGRRRPPARSASQRKRRTD